jgi:uncharacterized protein (TIGR02231 family)
VADTVDAPVLRVELFEDRAAVTRRIALDRAGRHALRIGPLTPLLVERSVTFPGGARATLEEVRVHRVRTTRVDADPARLRELERALRAGQDGVEPATDAHRRATERAVRAKAALESALGAAPRALVEQDRPERWVEAVAELAQQLRAAREAEGAAAIALQHLVDEQWRIQRNLDQGRSGHLVVQSWLELGVFAEEPGELHVRYVVPCAVWRPAHRAELLSGTPTRVRWELRAVCWNATGEDWDGVELVCSTARPGDLASPPRLQDDVVQTKKRDAQIVVEAREVQIQVAREGGVRASSEALGVDDGGEPRSWAAPEPVRLPSDGRPITVTLDGWESEATRRWVALPERAGAAVLRTVQHNRGARPLLAGPVELVRDGLGLGQGRVGLVAPGEPFPLGWGSHDGLRISRRRDHDVDRAMLTGRQRHTFKVEVRVVHLGSEPVRVEVRERVPTSELPVVTVSAPTADPALDVPMDADGFCRWTLDLEPGATRTLALTWTVDAASNVSLPF